MQQMAGRNPYFNILAPKVARNLSTAAYDSLFQTFKVIYPDYASSNFVSDLKTLVIDTILQRWSIHLQAADFYMMIDTDQGAHMIDDLPHSILDILNWYYPTWKTHQHLDAFTSRVARTSTLSDLSGTARPSSRPESQSAHAGGHEKQHDGAWIRLHGAEFGFVLQV